MTLGTDTGNPLQVQLDMISEHLGIDQKAYEQLLIAAAYGEIDLQEVASMREDGDPEVAELVLLAVGSGHLQVYDSPQWERGRVELRLTHVGRVWLTCWLASAPMLEVLEGMWGELSHLSGVYDGLADEASAEALSEESGGAPA